MLGTRIIMMGMSHSPLSSDAPPAAEMLCAANHEIPLLWLLPFSLADVVMFPVQQSSGDPINQVPGSEYPLLITDREEGLKRLSAWIEGLSPWLPENDLSLLQRWNSHLQGQDFPILAIDTYELWCNKQQPEQLSTEINATLERLEKGMDNPEQLFEELRTQGLWQSGNAIALGGFGW